MSGSGWELGLKQDAKSALSRANSSADRARSRMAANAGVHEDPGEPLVCPKCRQTQPTGLYCPDCDVELVGESFVDVVEPTGRPSGFGWVFGVVVAVCIGGLVVSMLVTIFRG
jgi:hypothetical protein